MNIYNYDEKELDLLLTKLRKEHITFLAFLAEFTIFAGALPIEIIDSKLNLEEKKKIIDDVKKYSTEDVESMGIVMPEVGTEYLKKIDGFYRSGVLKLRQKYLN